MPAPSSASALICKGRTAMPRSKPCWKRSGTGSGANIPLSSSGKVAAPNSGESVWRSTSPRTGTAAGATQQRVGPHGWVVVARYQDDAAHRRRIGKGERQGGERPPGVAHHNRALEVEMRPGQAEKVGLRRGGPRRAPWPVTVPVAGAI